MGVAPPTLPTLGAGLRPTAHFAFSEQTAQSDQRGKQEKLEKQEKHEKQERQEKQELPQQRTLIARSRLQLHAHVVQTSWLAESSVWEFFAWKFCLGVLVWEFWEFLSGSSVWDFFVWKFWDLCLGVSVLSGSSCLGVLVWEVIRKQGCHPQIKMTNLIWGLPPPNQIDQYGGLCF